MFRVPRAQLVVYKSCGINIHNNRAKPTFKSFFRTVTNCRRCSPSRVCSSECFGVPVPRCSPLRHTDTLSEHLKNNNDGTTVQGIRMIDGTPNAKEPSHSPLGFRNVHHASSSCMLVACVVWICDLYTCAQSLPDN